MLFGLTRKNKPLKEYLQYSIKGLSNIQLEV